MKRGRRSFPRHSRRTPPPPRPTHPTHALPSSPLLSLLSSGQTTAPLTLLPNEIFMAEMKRMQLKDCVPFCMLFAPMGPSEPVRCSGLAVCAGGVLLRRKRNQWIRTTSAASGEHREHRLDARPLEYRYRALKVSFVVQKFNSVQYKRM